MPWCSLINVFSVADQSGSGENNSNLSYSICYTTRNLEHFPASELPVLTVTSGESGLMCEHALQARGPKVLIDGLTCCWNIDQLQGLFFACCLTNCAYIFVSALLFDRDLWGAVCQGRGAGPAVRPHCPRVHSHPRVTTRWRHTEQVRDTKSEFFYVCVRLHPVSRNSPRHFCVLQAELHYFCLLPTKGDTQTYTAKCEYKLTHLSHSNH